MPPVKLLEFHRCSFTRSGEACRWLSQDQSAFEMVAADVPRYETIDGITFLHTDKPYSQGLRFTEDFSPGTWVKTNVTVTTNTTASPHYVDGVAQTTADTLTATAAGTASVSQVVSNATPNHATFSIWIVSGTTDRACVEVTDGVLTDREDLTLSALSTGGWGRRHSVHIGPDAVRPTVTVYLHHYGEQADAGDSIHVFGAGLPLYTTVGVAHVSSYIPRNNVAVSHGVERMLCTEDNYDSRMLSGVWGFYWIPAFSSPDGNASGADTSFFSCLSSSNEILWANTDSAVAGAAFAVRTREGPSFTTKVVGGPLTFSVEQPLVVVNDMPDGRNFTLGATAEGAHVMTGNGPIDWSIAGSSGTRAIRVFGRYNDDGQHVGDGWLSEPFLLTDDTIAAYASGGESEARYAAGGPVTSIYAAGGTAEADYASGGTGRGGYR